jgi:putative ABC transport system substrate-binding protein
MMAWPGSGDIMRRREFVGLVGTVAVWPLLARAQQAGGLPVIGWLSPRTSDAETEISVLAAFRQGLAQTGYVEGRNVSIEFRYADGQYEKLRVLADDLVGRKVALIVTSAGFQAAQAAQAATSAIPVVFATASDPVQDGLVSSINRPGGNSTGAYLLNNSLAPKRLEILHQLVPNADVVGFLINPSSETAEKQIGEALAAARSIGVRLVVLRASASSDIDAAFAALAQQRAGALLMGADAFFQVQQQQLIDRATQYKIPVIYEWPEFVRAGGLITYTIDRNEMWRQLGVYATRILNGAKPAELPIIQPTKFALIVNLKTARALGLKIEEAFLRLADEIIE